MKILNPLEKNEQVCECLPFEGATGIRDAPVLSAGPPASYLQPKINLTRQLREPEVYTN